MPVKSVPIKLDKLRRLCFDFNAIAELDDKFGMHIGIIAQTMAEWKATKMLGLGFLRKLIWAGLLKEEPDITLQDVGDILDKSGWINRASELGESLAKAFLGSAFIKEEDKKKVTESKSKNGSQKNSSKKTTG